MLLDSELLGKPSKVWITDTRSQGSIYGKDSIQVIPKLKGKTAKKLATHGLKVVNDLKALSGNIEHIKEIAASVDGVSKKGLEKFVKVSENSIGTDPPLPVDHRYADNPYKSLYADEWKTKIDKAAMTGKMCITDMIDFMFDQAQEAVGDNGMVYHDALVLMTCADSVSYMKEKGYYSKWILPEHDLMGPQGGVGGELKKYRNRPVGNRPEANPLDTSLFSQLNRSVDYHVTLTKDLNEDKKFSLSTPLRAASAYKRVWQVAPKSTTIVKDIRKVLVSFETVCNHKGVAVDGVGDRNGKRRTTTQAHGGYRPRTLKDDDYDKQRFELHDDAKASYNTLINKAQLKHEN
uniref:Uncharacterized protein n=1 Tax=Pseudo-nitzschia australis TaxID=44445 RepID=A0A7S4ACI6_9STRA